MVSTPPTESRLDAAHVGNAVRALLAYRERALAQSSSKALELDADAFTVQIGLRNAPVDPSLKPRQIPLPHALKDLDALSCCLIVKDSDKPWLKALCVEGDAPGPKARMTKLDGTREARRARREEPSRGAGAGSTAAETTAALDASRVVDKVLAFGKLRSSYKQFKDKRELRDRYDVFLADERVLPMLGKLLGSTFFGRKKQPLPVRVTRPEHLEANLKKAASAATVVIKAGTCVALAVAHTDMTPAQVAENVLAAVQAVVVDHVPKKWANVLTVALKLPESAALPLFNASPRPEPTADAAPAADAADAAPPAPKGGAKRKKAPKAAVAEAPPPAPAPKKAKKAASPARSPSLKDKLKARKV